MKRESFAVGDRVKVYGHYEYGVMHSDVTGTVETGTYEGRAFMYVRLKDDTIIHPHPNQCRRLKKRERRKVWISIGSLYRGGESMPVFFEPTPGCREFVEVRDDEA